MVFSNTNVEIQDGLYLEQKGDLLRLSILDHEGLGEYTAFMS